MYFGLTWKNNYNDTHTATGKCFVTGEEYAVTVPSQGLFWYHQGRSMQECFPDLSADAREFLISGTSPKGWKQLFGEPESVEPEPPANPYPWGSIGYMLFEQGKIDKPEE